MKERIKGFLTNFYGKARAALREFCSILGERIKGSYGRCREGEENLKILLVYWSTVPAVIYIFVRFKLDFYSFFEWLLDLFIIVLSVLDIFFIQKTLKKHPEYDSEFVREKEKEEYYASLSEEELEKIKSTEKKEGAKNFVKRLLLLDSSKGVDFYKIVRLLMILTLLLALKRFLM
jgi:hypothetical protein